MSNENGDAPKDEGAEIARTDGQAESAKPDRAAEKEKRVAPYLRSGGGKRETRCALSLSERSPYRCGDGNVGSGGAFIRASVFCRRLFCSDLVEL